MTSARRVALINDASFYVGPHLARSLAAREHDLVLGDPQEGLVDELTAMGANVEVVAGARDIAKPRSHASDASMPPRPRRAA